ncbi:ribosomal protein [Cyclospora cayetanensis]|uniref:Ribosomal protein n=1 Tax=Cyclospora cayetanensis TaxID=88456 RepID=A0A1D3D276_9EIME|nr:ribosomal protein [Cyclospora cayetanensis]
MRWGLKRRYPRGPPWGAPQGTRRGGPSIPERFNKFKSKFSSLKGVLVGRLGVFARGIEALPPVSSQNCGGETPRVDAAAAAAPLCAVASPQREGETEREGRVSREARRVCVLFPSSERDASQRVPGYDLGEGSPSLLAEAYPLISKRSCCAGGQSERHNDEGRGREAACDADALVASNSLPERPHTAQPSPQSQQQKRTKKRLVVDREKLSAASEALDEESDPWGVQPEDLVPSGAATQKLLATASRLALQRHTKDTGSSEAQVGILTARHVQRPKAQPPSSKYLMSTQASILRSGENTLTGGCGEREGGGSRALNAQLLQYLGVRDFERYAQILRILNIKPVNLPGSMDGLLRENRYMGRTQTDQDKKRCAVALRKAKAGEAFHERQRRREAEERKRVQQLRVKPSLLRRSLAAEETPPASKKSPAVHQELPLDNSAATP